MHTIPFHPPAKREHPHRQERLKHAEEVVISDLAGTVIWIPVTEVN